ncbi:MAG TPA: class I SAM-dependent methyltransferase [Caulobacteraceae bacterium]|jgi:SAM-dependent methyltransferase
MATPYDVVAYPTTAFRQTHPDRLAAHAALFGLPFAPPTECRVLDIGCGDGGNLIPMAATYPESRFVGLDLSEAAIGRGQAAITALGLTNIRLEARDLTQADYGDNAFDYIIAHGVYSWVPAPVRDGLLRLVRRHLAPNGVAFVSHNALPGARIRQAIRDMLMFHLRDVEGPQARVEAGAGHLQHYIDTFKDDVPFDAAVRLECRSMLERQRGVIAHDELGDVYDPLTFTEFLAHATQHKLQFLTEAGARRCGEGFRPPYAVDDPDFDVLAHVQKLDFDVLRPYRENLLVCAETLLNRRPEPARLLGLYASSSAVEVEPGVFDAGPIRFTVTEEVLIDAAKKLGAAWPAAVPIREVIDSEAAAGALLRMYWSGVINLHCAPFPYTTTVAERPRAFALARLQASRGDVHLTSPRHTTVEINDKVARDFIAGLDGARTVDEIAADMVGQIGGTLESVRGLVSSKLEELARLPLLV